MQETQANAVLNSATVYREDLAGIVRPTRVRWKVLGWLCSLSAITYIGRICIIQVRPDIEHSLGLTPSSIAYAFSGFSLAYALFEIPVEIGRAHV